jgi:hypothetical protein
MLQSDKFKIKWKKWKIDIAYNIKDKDKDKDEKINLLPVVFSAGCSVYDCNFCIWRGESV